MISVEQVRGKADENLWEQFVKSDSRSNGYHLLAWRDVVEKSFGHRTLYLMAKNEQGDVQGVLPLVFTKSPLFGKYFTSMAFFNYGGVLASGAPATEALLNAAAAAAKHDAAGYVELRQSEPLQTGWPVREKKVSMRLPLPADYESLLKSFSSKLRSQVRRAQKEGMTARVGGAELLDDFYEVFALCMRDLGTPVYDKKFFRVIVDAFPTDAKICVVSLDGKPLAAGFLYGYRDMLEIPWAASDKNFSRLAPNMLLYGTVLEYACQAGYKIFDFGRSSVESGTYRFKAQWGAKPHQLHWYYWTAAGQQIPELNPDNPKFKAAIAAWKRLPVAVTKLIGPPIVKYLP